MTLPNDYGVSPGIREVFEYCPQSGVFRRRSGGRRAGQRVDHLSNDLYRKVIDPETKRAIFAHRLAWWWEYGRWPDGFLDHIDGNPSFNAIDNLREVSHRQNMRHGQYLKRLERRHGLKRPFCVFDKQPLLRFYEERARIFRIGYDLGRLS